MGHRDHLHESDLESSRQSNIIKKTEKITIFDQGVAIPQDPLPNSGRVDVCFRHSYTLPVLT